MGLQRRLIYKHLYTAVGLMVAACGGGGDSQPGPDAGVPDGMAALAGLALSGIVADLGFSPEQLAYTADTPLLRETTTVTATATSPETTVTIAGMPAASGEPSAPLALGLGQTHIDIVVSHPSGQQRTYRVTVERAAALTQYAYGKASNTGALDQLGTSVSRSGDTLAVSATGEDSASAGVDGEQADDDAALSGAFYIFHWIGETRVRGELLAALPAMPRP